ncbi:MAG: hypothetical protein QOD29_2434 [Alphaproteobacteria bacterium]|jgi:hypothetical protein|nr:hypothetical protein [Alphaproteobacteria bacterium]
MFEAPGCLPSPPPRNRVDRGRSPLPETGRTLLRTSAHDRSDQGNRDKVTFRGATIWTVGGAAENEE